MVTCRCRLLSGGRFRGIKYFEIKLKKSWEREHFAKQKNVQDSSYSLSKYLTNLFPRLLERSLEATNIKIFPKPKGMIY